MRYLGRVIPVSWKNSELLASVLANVMNRKRLRFVYVIEVVNYLGHLLRRSYIFVTSYHLGESHLADSNHAAPSCVSYVGSFQVMVEFRKTRPISEPGSVEKSLIEEFILLLMILEINGYGLSENMNAIAGSGKVVFGELIEKGEHFIAHVEASVDYFLEGCKTAGFLNHNIMNCS